LFDEGGAPAPPSSRLRPVLAAWTGATFVFASKGKAVKSHRLDEDGHCSLAIDLDRAHLVVEGTAARLTGEADLTRASQALAEVYDWPTPVEGDELDAPYAAPTSGGPPFRAYELTPGRAHASPPTISSIQPASRSTDVLMAPRSRPDRAGSGCHPWASPAWAGPVEGGLARSVATQGNGQPTGSSCTVTGSSVLVEMGLVATRRVESSFQAMPSMGSASTRPTSPVANRISSGATDR
jgi:hypothetical protein